MKLLSLLLTVGATAALAKPIEDAEHIASNQASSLEARLEQKCDFDKNAEGAAGSLCYGAGVKNGGYCQPGLTCVSSCLPLGPIGTIRCTYSCACKG